MLFYKYYIENSIFNTQIHFVSQGTAGGFQNG